MPTSAPDFNAFASWSKPKSLLDFDAAKYVKPNVNPATGGYTGGPTGAPNGPTAGTQNFTTNATQAEGFRQGNQPSVMGGGNVGGPNSSAPLQQPGGNNSVPRTESLKRTLLRDTFGSKEAWGKSVGGAAAAVKDGLAKSGYQPNPIVEGPAKPAGVLARFVKGLSGAGAIYSGAGAIKDASNGNYGDAAIGAVDTAANLATATGSPAAVPAGIYLGAKGIASAANNSLTDNAKDAIGGTINQGVRSLGAKLGQDWGVDDSAYLAQKAETSLRNPQPAASVATQPRPSSPQAAANPALPAANTQPTPPTATTPTNTLRGLPGTDMGRGISKFVQGGRTLFSNVQGGDNDSLMNRGAVSAQNQRAMDGIQARQDQGDAAYATKAKYDAEVADATALRGGGTDLASRIARQGPNHAVASMLVDQQNKAVLRGQTLNYDATVQGHDQTRNSNIERLRYDMQKDKRDFDISRSDYANTRSDKAAERGDKALDQRQSAEKAWKDHAHTLFQTRDDKGNSVPDTAKAAEYTRTIDHTISQMVPEMMKSGDPRAVAYATDLSQRGRAALSTTDLGNMQQWFTTRDVHSGSGGFGPFNSGGKVSDNLRDYAVGKKSSTLLQDRTDFGGGRSIPNTNLQFGKDANHILWNSGPGNNYLTPNNLRSN